MYPSNSFLLYFEGYRIAMCGTISLYDDEGERLHTLYCAEAPEYGKQTFINRFTGEIQKIRKKLHDLKHEKGAAKFSEQLS